MSTLAMQTPHASPGGYHCVRFTGFILCIWMASVAAQTYPSRPLRLIVGSSAGGGGDGLARVLSHKMSSLLGQPMVVDNRPGAAGNIGTEMVAHASADGYTLLLAYTGHVINPALFKNLAFDPIRDFSLIGTIATNQSVLVVHPNLPVQSVRELIQWAKTHSLSIAALPGSSQHLAGELFKTMAGIDWLFVPYKGNGPATNDLLSGQVNLMFNTLVLVQPFLKSARLRALATTGEKRSESTPDLPTISEAGLKGFSCTGWYGLAAPAHTPRAIVLRLNASMNHALADPETAKYIKASGNDISPSTPEEFDQRVRIEIPKWAEIAKRAGIKAE